MSGSVDNVDLDSFIGDSGIFGKDRNATFPFNVVGVHNPLCNILIFTENAALLEKLVN